MAEILHVKRQRRQQQAKSGWVGVKVEVDEGLYARNLQLYDVPPVEDISLEEFESFAVDRLKLLRAVEVAKIRASGTRDENYRKQMQEAIKKFMPLTNSESRFHERRKDHVSHFILRLAYCRSEDLRRWFLAQETDLFRFRIEDPDTFRQFVKENNIQYTPISKDQRDSMAAELSTFLFNRRSIDEMTFFMVPFQEALELVKKRLVYLRGGMAYVPQAEMVSIVTGLFRARLSAELTATSKALPNIEEDDRLLPMLAALSKQQVANEFGMKKGDGLTVTAADIPRLAEESFPLCMRHTQDSLARDHHLKHVGRLQYGLFLKGIGLSLEEALMFWRTEFSKVMAVDKFDKQYAYNIRYNYGKEGKRTNYTPYSCMKIIQSNHPGPGENHGCPFRHFDADSLRTRLTSYKVAQADISEILGLVKDHHYQVACTRYFEITHKIPQAEFSLQHPNQYFEESRKIRTNGQSSTGAAGSSSSFSSPSASAAAGAASTAVKTEDTMGDGELDDEAILQAMEDSDNDF